MTDGVRYEPDTTDFSAALADLSTQVQAAVGSAGPDKVAVYLAGFEEVANVFTAAHTVTGLDGVRWYGGDGSAQSKALLASGPATFATSVKVKGYPSPLVAVPAAEAKRDANLVSRDHETGQERGRRLHAWPRTTRSMSRRARSPTRPSMPTPPRCERRSRGPPKAPRAPPGRSTSTPRVTGCRPPTPSGPSASEASARGGRRPERGRRQPTRPAPGRVTPKSCPKS